MLLGMIVEAVVGSLVVGQIASLYLNSYFPYYKTVGSENPRHAQWKWADKIRNKKIGNTHSE